MSQLRTFLSFEPFDRFVLIRLIMDCQPSHKFVIVQVWDFVIDTHLEGTVIPFGHQAETVGEIEISLVELDSMSGFVVEPFELFWNFDAGIFRFFFGGYIVIADTQIPLINDGFQSLINQRRSFWGSFTLHRQSSFPLLN